LASRARVLVGEFGGAGSTLASLGPVGLQVQELLLKNLDLAAPAIPVKTAGADVIAVGGTGAPSGALALFQPPVDPLVAPLVYTPPLQIFAHRVAYGWVAPSTDHEASKRW